MRSAATRPTSPAMDLKEILQIPNVGKSIAEKIEEFLATGTIAALEELREQIPPGVREMMEVPGLGPKKAMLLYQDLGIADVRASCARPSTPGGWTGVKGFGAKTEENIRRGIERLQQAGGRVVSSVAMDVAEYFLERLGGREGRARGSSTRARSDAWPRRSATSTCSWRATSPPG